MSNDRAAVQFLLRAGLALSVILMMVGLVLSMTLNGGHASANGVPMFDLFKEGVALPERLMGLGIFTLAMTPALRVACLTVLWTHEKDWRFVMVSIIVLITLGFSIAIGA
jgi:uncharacterized membrane protein